MFGFAQPELHTPEYDVRGDEVAVIETSQGVIRVRLDGDGAPIHVGNFCELATMGFYDGLKFHRYVPNFVIQGGCPNTRDMAPEDVAAGKPGPDGMPGTGGPGWRIKAEFMSNPRNSHVDGALAMARSQHPDSAGSQFYFCLGPSITSIRGTLCSGRRSRRLDVIGRLRAGDEIRHIEIVHEAA